MERTSTLGTFVKTTINRMSVEMIDRSGMISKTGLKMMNNRKMLTSIYWRWILLTKENSCSRMQEELFKDVFSLDRLRNSNNIESFVNSLRIRSPTEVMFAKLISFQQKAKLSRDLSNEFLQIIQSFEPQLDVPRDWRTIRRYIMKTMKICNSFTLKKTMEWPPHWRMHLWNEPMKKTGKVELLTRDPYECMHSIKIM